MLTSHISDLDELVLTVRDRASRSYIGEAINAYRGGAYRSALISTWIAVAYDIITKIRELEVQGEPQAAAFSQNLSNAINSGNQGPLQNIEDGLLSVAFNDFAFLTKYEHDDLVRLKKDRNLCAHPAFTSEELLFQPTPELVRTHIVHTIVHLLSRPPIQGKAAIQRVKRDLLQTSFPEDVESISVFMNTKYLDRIRPSSVRGLLDVLVKALLLENDPDLSGKEQVVSYVILAISRKHPVIYQDYMTSKGADLVEALDDSKILSAIWLLRIDNQCWRHLKKHSQMQILHVIAKIKPKDITELAARYKAFDLLTIPDLQEVLLSLFAQAEDVGQMNVISNNPRPEFIKKAIELYADAQSYRSAEYLGKAVIIPMLPYMSAEDVASTITAVRNNRQIWEAGETKETLIKLFEETRKYLNQTKGAWNEFLQHVTSYHEAESYYGYPEIRDRIEKQ